MCILPSELLSNFVLLFGDFFYAAVSYNLNSPEVVCTGTFITFCNPRRSDIVSVVVDIIVDL